MAITTYSELKTSIADYLNRSDLTSIIPTFISLAEAQINRDVRTWQMENRARTSKETQSQKDGAMGKSWDAARGSDNQRSVPRSGLSNTWGTPNLTNPPTETQEELKRGGHILGPLLPTRLGARD